MFYTIFKIGGILSQELLQKLQSGIFEYDGEKVKLLAVESLKAGISPLEVMSVLTDAIREVGAKFGRNEIFLF